MPAAFALCAGAWVLRVRAVALEEIVSEFGFGEVSLEAILGFLTHAFQHWPEPSFRYLLLLGDGGTTPRSRYRRASVDKDGVSKKRIGYLLVQRRSQLEVHRVELVDVHPVRALASQPGPITAAPQIAY